MASSDEKELEKKNQNNEKTCSTFDRETGSEGCAAGLVDGQARVVARVVRAEANKGQQGGEVVHRGHGQQRPGLQPNQLRPGATGGDGQGGVLEPAKSYRGVSPSQPAEEAGPDALAVDLGGGGERDDFWGDWKPKREKTLREVV